MAKRECSLASRELQTWGRIVQYGSQSIRLQTVTRYFLSEVPPVRRLLRLSVFAVVLSVSIVVPPAIAQDSRPNILLVLFDDVGFTDFGAYGGYARTPTIDALARQGTKFSRFYSSPFCGPSRAMLLTGMDNHQVGMGTLVETVTPEMKKYPGYSMKWKDDQKTIASLLSKAGYQTFVTGKWGIGKTGANLPNRFGFDRSYVMDATGGSNYDASPYLPGYDDVRGSKMVNR